MMIVWEPSGSNCGGITKSVILPGQKHTLEFILFFFPFRRPPKSVAFCFVLAWRCSKLWALTLTPGSAFSQRELLHHHRMPWPACTNCPPWSRSCSKLSAGMSRQLKKYRWRPLPVASLDFRSVCVTVTVWQILQVHLDPCLSVTPTEECDLA